MSYRSDDEAVDTLVIGGGQAGLATSYYLAKNDIEHIVVDENQRVGDSWRKRWDSLRLFTPSRYNGLPGMTFPGPAGAYPGKDDVADYFATYASRFDLPVRSGTQVDRLWFDGAQFEAMAGTDRIRARNVVVATGSYRSPSVPEFARDLDDSILQLHSSDYRRPSQLREGAVLVVGAGNSGAEIAFELSRDHETFLSGSDVGREPTRAGTVPDRLFTPIMWFMASHVLSVNNPLGRKVRDYFLHPPRGIPWGRMSRRALERAWVNRLPRTDGVTDGQPMIEGGRVLLVSNVIWCTGFEPNFSWIDLPIFDDYGWPITDRGVVLEPAGIYFMGMQFQHTLSSALLGGVGRDAAHVVDQIMMREPEPRMNRNDRVKG